MKTHRDVSNNANENMQTKFKGKPKRGNIVAKVQKSITNLGSDLCIQKVVIRAQEELIGTPCTAGVTIRQLTSSWK